MAGPNALSSYKFGGGRQSANVEDQRGDAVKPLTDDERNAAVAASFVDQALLGYGDYPLAGLMTLMRGPGWRAGTEAGSKHFASELGRAKNLQYRLRQQDPVSNVAVRGAGLVSPWSIYNLARAAAPTALASLWGMGGAALSAPQVIDDTIPETDADLYRAKR